MVFAIQRCARFTPSGTRPILVVATDDGNLEMANGKVFSTGNHPIEMLVPMLHFRDAGFKFDFATASGKPVVLEMWAYPTADKNVKAMFGNFDIVLDISHAFFSSIYRTRAVYCDVPYFVHRRTACRVVVADPNYFVWLYYTCLSKNINEFRLMASGTTRSEA